MSFEYKRELAGRVIEEMLVEQERHGNTRDYTVFYDDLVADTAQGGFDWGTSLEGEDYWEELIGNSTTFSGVVAQVLEDMYVADHPTIPPTETHIINDETFIL